MPLNIPSRTNVVRALQAYVREALPGLDPSVTTRRGFIGGMVKSLGSSLHDWYVALQRAAREFFPQTATNEFLVQGWWSDITGLSRNPAAPARGKILITGTAGTIVPSGAVLSSGGQTYTTDNAVVIVSQYLRPVTLTRDVDRAIFETSSPHYLATGMTVEIANATPADYNGTHVITVTSDNEFTYAIADDVTTPALGDITAAATWGNADITADSNGTAGNLADGTQLSFSAPVSGLNATAIVTFGEIGGGTDIEDLEDFRERVLEALGTDFGMFSADEIKIVAKQVPGVTRVWVNQATLGGTNGVYEGQVKIGFMRDNDANPFPSSQEVNAVRDYIIANIMPAQTAPEDVMVFSPTKKTVNFTFTALSPDTASMRLAIRTRLEQYFDESVDLGTNITEDDYRCAIKESFDLDRRQQLKTFTLSAPDGDVTCDPDELPVLGTITFP